MLRVFALMAVVGVVGVAATAWGGEMRYPNHVARAEELCRFDGSRWACAGLEQFNVETTASGESNGPESWTSNPIAREDGCVLGVRIVGSGHQDVLRVDWTRVTLTAAGRAVQVVPGFARNMVASLSQRPSVAAPGASLDETVFAMGGECVLPAGLASDAGDTTELVVPYTVGADERVARMTVVRRYVAMSDHDAFALVREPAAPMEEPDTSRRAWGYTPCLLAGPGLSLGAGGVGAATCAGAVVLGGIIGVAIRTSPVGTADSFASGATAGLGYWCCLGAPAGALATVAAFLCGAGIDVAALVGYLSDGAHRALAMRLHETWEADEVRHRTWAQKRAELGLAVVQ